MACASGNAGDAWVSAHNFQLHHDNLRALAREDPLLGTVPSYPTVCRFMKEQGLLRARKRRHREHPDGEPPFEMRERRSYEITHVHGLWHLDFHEGSRPVLTVEGQWRKPRLLGVLDDRSRLCCHLQWYFEETAEVLIHGLSQAFQKRKLPRALLTHNGAAMFAAESSAFSCVEQTASGHEQPRDHLRVARVDRACDD